MWKIRSTSYLGDLTSGTVTGKYLEQETKHLTFSSLNIAEDKLYYNSVLLQNETDKKNYESEQEFIIEYNLAYKGHTTTYARTRETYIRNLARRCIYDIRYNSVYLVHAGSAGKCHNRK